MNRLLVGLVLAGLCFSVHAKKAEAPKTPAELSIDHGYVRVSLPQWEYATEFSLRKSGEKREVLAPKLTERMGTRSFGGWIPAGDYDVVNMNGADGKRQPPIAVRPGEFVDLGAIVRVPIGGYEYVLLTVRDSESEAESDAARAALEPLLKVGTVRWQPAGLPGPAKYRDPSPNLGLIAGLLVAHDRKKNQPPLSKQLRAATSSDELLMLAKALLPPRVEEAGVDGSGNLYFGAELGQIRTRRTDGSWGALDTGTLTEITAVEVSGERIVAGDLRGGLRASDDGGKTWRVLRALDAGQTVFDIDRAGNRWLVITGDFIEQPPATGFAAAPPGTPRGWSLGANVHVYSGTQDDLSDLTSMLQIPVPPPAGPMHVRYAIDAYAGQVANGFYFLTSHKNLRRLELETMQWAEYDVGHRVDSLRISRDGKLLTAKRMQGAFSKVSVSSDNGMTWTKYARPPYTIYDVVLETADSGNATRWNSNAFGVQLEFYTYDQKINDWRKAYESPPECVQLLRDAAYEQRYCLTAGGSILVREGEAWVAEFALE